jgi:cytoskeletal protein CcmA (bactofilin family)
MQKSDTMMNILGNGTKFKGNLKVAGSLRIDGDFDGDMSISETLIIGKSGKLKGTIAAKNSIIGGRVVGNLDTKEKVELQSGACFEGDLMCKKLIVEEGVLFDGNCKMSDKKIEQAVSKDKQPPKSKQ